MSRHSWLRVIFLRWLPGVLCTACNYTTLPVTSVPILNVTFNIEGTSVNGTSQSRGLNMSVGTPPQSLSFVLDPYNNNTYVPSPIIWNENFRATIPEDQFASEMGGLFFGNSSTTWSTRSDYLAAGASEEDAPVPTTSFWGTDILRTNADLNLQNYPLDIVGGGGNNLGMGRNSTFLNELVSMNAIASRTWSLFWGWAGFGESAQFEGLAVFGGFDQAKVTGPNITVDLTFDTGCMTGMIVEVASIEIVFQDGKTVPLQNESSPLKYCLDPTHRLLSLHPTAISTFKDNVLGTFIGNSAVGINQSLALLYLTDHIFGGKLNFTFSSGLSVLVDNTQLIAPDYTIADNGSVVYNESTRAILLEQGSVNDVNLLGQPLLTALYAMVTLDTNPPALTLWQSSNNATVDFAAIDDEGNICSSSGLIGSVVKDPENLDATGTSSPSSSTSSSHSSKSGLSSGRIAGIAIGAVAIAIGLVVLGITACLVLRKKQRQKSSRASTDGQSGSSADEERTSNTETVHKGTIVSNEVGTYESMAKEEQPKAELLGDTAEPREMEA